MWPVSWSVEVGEPCHLAARDRQIFPNLVVVSLNCGWFHHVSYWGFAQGYIFSCKLTTFVREILTFSGAKLQQYTTIIYKLTRTVCPFWHSYMMLYEYTIYPYQQPSCFSDVTVRSFQLQMCIPSGLPAVTARNPAANGLQRRDQRPNTSRSSQAPRPRPDQRVSAWILEVFSRLFACFHTLRSCWGLFETWFSLISSTD